MTSSLAAQPSNLKEMHLPTLILDETVVMATCEICHSLVRYCDTTDTAKLCLDSWVAETVGSQYELF